MNQLVMSFGEVQGSQAEDGGACWAGGNLMLGRNHQLVIGDTVDG